MIVRLVILVDAIAGFNRAATSAAEETLSHATKGNQLCMLEVHFLVLLIKKVILKRFTDLCDDLVGYAVGIGVFKLQISDEKVQVLQFCSYQS